MIQPPITAAGAKRLAIDSFKKDDYHRINDKIIEQAKNGHTSCFIAEKDLTDEVRCKLNDFGFSIESFTGDLIKIGWN